MRIITEIGEQGLTLGERTVKLRPSFHAMTLLGEPEEIVEKFVALHKPPPLIEHFEFDGDGVKYAGDRVNHDTINRYFREMLFLSWEVITACAGEQDVTPFIGEPGARYGSYRLGKVPPEAMLALARNLMHHGCIGKPQPETGEKKGTHSGGEFVRAFEALKFVSLAVAHLGVTEAEAWDLTLTGFQAFWEAKHGKQQERRYVDEHVKTMAWLAEINKLRDPQR